MTIPPAQRRRAARLKTQLKLQVDGFDADYAIVEGDVSVVGLYVELPHDSGELGSIQRLRLATLQNTERITLLARVARISKVADFWRGEATTGVAFQFMFQETNELGSDVKTIPIERSWAIGEFVRCLVRDSEGGEQKVDHVWSATLEGTDGEARTATVNGVSLQGTVLETEFCVPVGELIRVDIPGPGPEQRIPLFGRAIDSRPFETSMRKGFRTAVSFEPAEMPMRHSRHSGSSIQEAFGALLSVNGTAAPPPLPETRRQHFAGDLTHVSLVSVLTLCELERATGVLRLRSSLDEVRCYLSNGRLFDAERVGFGGPSTPEAALAPVLEWHEGTFELSFEPISRADRVGRPIGALLLNLMHSLDETRRLQTGHSPLD
ncbi:MAG TPA: DUF4388 domain-containing protein [Polyangiales bacterium]|nr:DUF4388 domain-containing protein [Polyangiales bacterium]